MSPLLEKICSEIEQLTVMGYLVECVKKHLTQPQPKPKWSDLKGMAPYPLLGEDAQSLLF